MSREQEKGFRLDMNLGYFRNGGVDVMAFDDIYPAGHQSGVGIIMHGSRVAANGDLRFEQTPGQWQPVPRQGERRLDEKAHSISTQLSYPDPSKHLKGFNPVLYPDFQFEYTVTVTGQQDSVLVTVDLDRPVPEKYVGKLCFNLELFPGLLFGKTWIMDEKSGIFPRQPNGPVRRQPSNYPYTDWQPAESGGADRSRLSGGGRGYNPILADDLIAEPYGEGRRFVLCPEDACHSFSVESLTASLKLFDGRMNHNNGWFVLCSEVPAKVDKGAIQWRITPRVVKDWLYTPVVQTSQVGYHPGQPKIAVVELDSRDDRRDRAVLIRITEQGEEKVAVIDGREWGSFLRYRYLQFDFSGARKEGLYKLRYGRSESCVFRIAEDVYDRGIWQPVLEYFLPIQMCHMKVSEKYRVWHGLCHEDDARMAPVNFTHFDGYVQEPSTLTGYKSGDVVPGLNTGGWHDAGDFDLRVESQAGEVYNLTLAYEEFGVDYDVTAIDQKRKMVEIHQPDGKNDILQQIEHGVLSLVGGYRSLGRLYRGIICNDLRQYVLLGDSSVMTDGVMGNEDDRWVFTESNPPRELTVAAQLAAAARALKGFNDTLSSQALEAAEELFDITDRKGGARQAGIHAAAELYLTTGERKYREVLLSEKEYMGENINEMGWIACRVADRLADNGFTETVRQAAQGLKARFEELSGKTPYGIPYRPHIWGAGWEIQRLGFQYYFLHKAFPEMFGAEFLFNALNFVLGCHPGSNTASFASGVGSRSVTTAYGMNRADWSYVPGGVVSGTALIRPDFPELLEFPYLWQQTEYVVGGGSTCYMFLVLAVQHILKEGKK